MKIAKPYHAGFTLTETAVASLVASIILVSIIIGGVSLQRTFSGSDYSLKAIADQSRMLDYVARDVRQALAVTISADGQRMDLDLPDYLDPVTKAVRIPRVKMIKSRWGVPTKVNVDYGTGTPIAPLRVSYYLSGNNVVRAENGVPMVISRDTNNLGIQFALNTDSSGVVTSVTFAPRFNFQAASADRSRTTLYATAIRRNTLR